MFKRVVNVKNVILLALILVLLILIYRQQSTLDDKAGSFYAAASESRRIETIGEAQMLENSMSDSASEEENHARSEGYIYSGEKVIVYD